MRALIVDDEAFARLDLRCALEQLQVQVVGEACDAHDALKQLSTCSPDVVFLDITMPRMNGLEAAKQLNGQAVIFVTAHDHFAVQAFDIDACDYVQKPVSNERLAQALKRAERRVDLVEQSAQTTKLRVIEKNRTYWIDAHRVECFAAQDKYISFHLDGVEHLLRDSLDRLEKQLTPLGFVRTHRAHLVQRNAIASHDDVTVFMTSGAQVPLAKRQRALLKTFHPH